MNFHFNKSNIFMVLSKGENINETFESFALIKDIRCAWINGIGAIKNPEIGYYSLKNKLYKRKQFKGEFELTTLIGNITIKKKQPFAHTHITFSDEKYRIHGGHLFDAQISVTGEFIIQLGKTVIKRKMDNEIGLPLWCLKGKNE